MTTFSSAHDTSESHDINFHAIERLVHKRSAAEAFDRDALTQLLYEGTKRPCQEPSLNLIPYADSNNTSYANIRGIYEHNEFVFPPTTEGLLGGFGCPASEDIPPAPLVLPFFHEPSPPPPEGTISRLAAPAQPSPLLSLRRLPSTSASESVSASVLMTVPGQHPALSSSVLAALRASRQDSASAGSGFNSSALSSVDRNSITMPDSTVPCQLQQLQAQYGHDNGACSMSLLDTLSASSLLSASSFAETAAATTSAGVVNMSCDTVGQPSHHLDLGRLTPVFRHSSQQGDLMPSFALHDPSLDTMSSTSCPLTGSGSAASSSTSGSATVGALSVHDPAAALAALVAVTSGTPSGSTLADQLTPAHLSSLISMLASQSPAFAQAALHGLKMHLASAATTPATAPPTSAPAPAPAPAPAAPSVSAIGTGSGEGRPGSMLTGLVGLPFELPAAKLAVHAATPTPKHAPPAVRVKHEPACEVPAPLPLDAAEPSGRAPAVRAKRAVRKTTAPYSRPDDADADADGELDLESVVEKKTVASRKKYRAKQFQCQVCGKRFHQQGNLRNHARTHTGEQPFQCQLCGKRFNRKWNLTKHARTHTGERPYPCLECNKRFAQKHDLKRHMRTHTGEQPFSCTLCGKGFNRKGNLLKHLTLHSTTGSGSGASSESPARMSTSSDSEQSDPEIEAEAVLSATSSSGSDSDMSPASPAGLDSDLMQLSAPSSPASPQQQQVQAPAPAVARLGGLRKRVPRA